MNRVQLLKLAYARGAYLALQEAGYNEKVAEDLAIKIADRDAMDVLEDVGIGAGVGGLGGAALGAGAGALYNPAMRAFAGSAPRNLSKMVAPGMSDPGMNTLRQKVLAELVGGVPAADQLAGQYAGGATNAMANAPKSLQELIRNSDMAGNINLGARSGFGAGMGAGGLIGGLAGE